MIVMQGKYDRLVNLTGHKLTFLVEDGTGAEWEVDVESSGSAVVRNDMAVVDHVVLDECFLPVLEVGDRRHIDGLPDPVDGVLYVTTGIVAAAAASRGREDVVSPGKIVRRGRNGQVVGAKSLIRLRHTDRKGE